MGKYLGFFLVLVFSVNAFAYVGPGAAGGALVGFLGIVLFLILSLFGILFYPIKRAIKRRQRDKPKPEIDD